MDVLFLETGVNRYGFVVYPVGTVFNSVSGVYVLLAPPNPPLGGGPSVGDMSFEVLYIGIASSFRHRFYNHPTFVMAKGQGMSHIGILKISSGRKRRKIEKELVDFLEPPLNRYLV